MENCDIKVQGDKLVITVDLKQRLRPSGTGKTVIVGTTAGNAAIPGHPGIKVGLNVFAALDAGVTKASKAA
jgi:hypothetical protein